MTDLSLTGSVSVVSGASRGIGRHIAEFLASKGSAVAICARSAATLDEFDAWLRSEYGVATHVGVVDIVDSRTVNDFADEVVTRLGVPDLLVNNAGVLGPVGRLDQCDSDDWQAALSVNVAGLVNVTKAFVGSMVDRGRGSIINMSGAGIGGPNMPGWLSAYAASKGAVVILTEVLAREFDGTGVRINALAPGMMNTGFMDPAVEAGPEKAGAELFERSRRIQLQDDAGALSQLAEWVHYLASDASSWLTGRLLSTRWDRIEELNALRDRLDLGSRWTLRRIDDVLFKEQPH